MNSTQTFNMNITEEAATELKSLMIDEGQPNAFLRVWVSGGGCSGLQYGMALDPEREEDDIEVKDRDITIVVDTLSAQYLGGSTIEYHDDQLGGGFKVNNPNAKRSCGCGSSFSPDETPTENPGCQGCRCS
jgi:iron-sulfur cluster assembly accessory protein